MSVRYDRVWFVSSVSDPQSGPDEKARVQIDALSRLSRQIRVIRPRSRLRVLRCLESLVRCLWLLRRERPEWVFVRYDIYTALSLGLFRVAGSPIIAEVNGVLPREVSFLKRLPQGVADRLFLRHASHVIVPSQSVKAYVSRIAGLSEEKIHVVRNPVRVPSQVSPYHPNAMPTILYVGAFRASHGIDIFMRMMATKPLEDVQLVLAGDGPLRKRVLALARELGILSRVRWLGWVDYAEQLRLASSADVGLGPLAVSRTGLEDASPLKVGAYLSAGLPVLIGYSDRELQGKPFVCTLVGDSALDDATVTRQFITAVRGNERIRHEAWAFALENFSASTWVRTVASILDGAAAKSGGQAPSSVS